MVGISHSVNRQCGRSRHLVFYRSNDWSPLAAASSGKVEATARLRTGGGARRLEAHSLESVASALSHKLNELFVRPDQNSFPHMHDLDRDWPGTGTVSVRLSWDVGAIGVAAGARTNAPAGLRILGLGRRAAPLSGDPRVDGPRCLASSRKTSATIGCFARGCVMPSNFARVLNVYYIMVVSPIRAGRIFGKMAAPFRCEDGRLFWGASPFARRTAHRRGM